MKIVTLETELSKITKHMKSFVGNVANELASEISVRVSF